VIRLNNLCPHKKSLEALDNYIYQNGSKDDHKESRAEHETAELNLSEEQSAA